MSNISHHLNDQLLLGYASGNLPEAFNLVVATHLSLCDDCRARLESMDAVGGALLDDLPVAALADDSFERAMALIEAAPEVKPAPARPSCDVLPAPLTDYVGGGIGAVKWRAVGGGVKQAILPTSKDASVRLLSIPGGAAMPDHGHRGMELTLVLQGAFSDDDGRYGRGDIEIANEELEHTPIAEPGPDCICLAATDAPLRFTSLLPRLVQPFIKI